MNESRRANLLQAVDGSPLTQRGYRSAHNEGQGAATLQWSEALRGLAAGISIASLLLVPYGGSVAAATRNPLVQEADVQPISTIADGPVDARMAFWTTAYGVERLSGERETTISAMRELSGSAGDSRDLDRRFLPLDVRIESELPVETLARLVGVSRMRYHEWLRGAGISEEKAIRLGELLETFRALRALRGEGLRAFLEASTPAGSPLGLLERGESAAVLGLALRSPAAPAVPMSVSDMARRASGAPGWLRPARRLAWQSPRASSEEREDIRARLSPRAQSEAVEYLDAEQQDDAQVAVASVLFVE